MSEKTKSLMRDVIARLEEIRNETVREDCVAAARRKMEADTLHSPQAIRRVATALLTEDLL